MQKRSFVLLEIIIAFSLVGLCIVPLVRQPLKLYQNEMQFLEKMELERLADWTFTEIKERLLKNEIPWGELPRGKKQRTAPYPLPPVKIEIPSCKTKEVKRNFVLEGRGEKKGSKNQDILQIGVFVYLNEQEYEFRLPIQKVFVE
jgi:hypothetical protein